MSICKSLFLGQPGVYTVCGMRVEFSDDALPSARTWSQKPQPLATKINSFLGHLADFALRSPFLLFAHEMGHALAVQRLIGKPTTVWIRCGNAAFVDSAHRKYGNAEGNTTVSGCSRLSHWQLSAIAIAGPLVELVAMICQAAVFSVLFNYISAYAAVTRAAHVVKTIASYALWIPKMTSMARLGITMAAHIAGAVLPGIGHDFTAISQVSGPLVAGPARLAFVAATGFGLLKVWRL